MSDRLAEAVLNHLSDAVDATYTPATGDPVTGVRVLVDRDIERTIAGMQGAVMERRTELTAHVDVLGEAQRGETVTVGSDVWVLVVEAINDGALVTWVVKPER